ncbi:hypothetical protein M501DRAFT_940815 [Patellaria atrata CBS 101060]|uniref:LEA domain protein n=1 Tax=Patellaria atrata CBS 101060 TaxID=1346257 RepID=A0A9P4VPW0_9PEZI|nr:hypothetical protein M501DRAFT_940815 [Patellaria atrata CBS 101060]
MFRTAIARQARLFTTSARVQKTATETVKDGLKAVDRTVSDVAVKGIEVGATQAIKETVGTNTSKAAGETQGAAHEMSGSAKGTSSELAGKAKGTAQEMAGKAKGTKEEIKGKM